MGLTIKAVEVALLQHPTIVRWMDWWRSFPCRNKEAYYIPSRMQMWQCFILFLYFYYVLSCITNKSYKNTTSYNYDNKIIIIIIILIHEISYTIPF